jgi:hypothetical protein
MAACVASAFRLFEQIFELKALPAQPFIERSYLFSSIFMSWHARLSSGLQRTRGAKPGRCLNTANLRVQNLYRDDGICHNVIVHPPAGWSAETRWTCV